MLVGDKRHRHKSNPNLSLRPNAFALKPARKSDMITPKPNTFANTPAAQSARRANPHIYTNPYYKEKNL